MLQKTIRNFCVVILSMIVVGLTTSTGYTEGDPPVYFLQGSLITTGILVETGSTPPYEHPEIGVTAVDAELFDKNTPPVRLREVPTWNFTEPPSSPPPPPAKGETNVGYPISGDLEPRATTRGNVFPGEPNPITFGDWIQASVCGMVRVMPNGRSKVSLTFHDLLPYSLYTVWQFNCGQVRNDGPFGGIPNVMCTDENGKASFERELPYNPIGFIKKLVIMYHSNNSVHAGVPRTTNSPAPLPQNPPYPGSGSGGITNHGHLQIDFPECP
jgi:hypothetical protein